MVSVAWSISGRESVLGILARWLRRRGREVRAFLAVAIRFVMVLAALGAFVWAAWRWDMSAGLVVAGASLLLLEWIVKRR